MKNAILLLFLSINLTAYSQDYKFGKVSKDELQEKFNSLDSTANATYLFKYRKTYFEYRQEEGFVLVTDIHERLKIYNQEGFSYATNSALAYKSGGVKEKVTGLKGYTYNLIKDKVSEDKLKKDAIFETEISKFRDEVKFTMPNIKNGSVIEYKYKIVSPFATNVDEFVFQHDIPVKKIEASFEAPEYYNFKLNAKGYLNIVPVKETKQDKIEFTTKSRSNDSGRDLNNINTSYSRSIVEFTKQIWKYNLSNIPALKEESFVNNISNYRSSVKYELSYTQFPDSPMEYYSTTWEDVVKTIYESEDFGRELTRSNYYKDDIDKLLINNPSPQEKIRLIYNYVKSRVKWNSYYSKYTNDGVREAYKDQVGNVAEINLMLTSMLRYAGINSNPVLISTRQNGIPLFPTREGYNYVISCVEIPDGVILLDATSKYSSSNILPFRTLNWEGRIIRKNGSSALINLYPKEKSKKTVSMMVGFDENGNINGTIRTLMTAYRAMRYRESYIGTNKEQFLGMLISNFEVKNDLELSKPIMETYKFTLESQADVIGDEMYISPLFFLSTMENPFKLEKREFPVDFGYPYMDKFMVNINIPEGYIVESMPNPKMIKLPNNLGAFKYDIAENNTKIQLVVESEINEAIISASYYEALKEYFKQMIEKENEQIVLKKL